MTEQISGTAIGGMATTILVCFGLVAAVLIYGLVKKKGRFVSVLIGAGTFIVFALVLESLLHLLMQTVFGEKLTGNLWVYALYGGLAAGLFEETGRFLSMKFLMKNTLSKGNAFMYGVGHGGAEAIIVGGTASISNLVLSMIINSGRMEMMLADLEGTLRTQTLAQISALWTTPAADFYLAAVERIFAFILQLCLSYIVYRAVKIRKTAFYLLAVLIHFVVDAGIVLLSKACSVYVTEAALGVFVLVLAFFVYRQYKGEQA